MRALRFLLRYVRNPLFILIYGTLYFIPRFRIRLHLYDESEVRTLLTEGRSLIRLGDGEINVLLRLRNHYHAFSPELRRTLLEVIRGHRSGGAYVLAVPHAITLRNDTLKTMRRFNIWLPFKAMFLLTFPRHLSYIDAHCFYYDGYAERVLAPALKGRIIVLITNAKTIEKQRMNPRIPWKDMRFVETPEEELLGAYDDLVHRIDQTLAALPDEALAALLFAVGPAGKRLMKRYSDAGQQCIDIGRGAETMFTDDSIESLI